MYIFLSLFYSSEVQEDNQSPSIPFHALLYAITHFKNL